MRWGGQPSARHRAIARHLRAAVVRVGGLVASWIGAAVPVGLSDQAVAELLASVPYPVRAATDADLTDQPSDDPGPH